MQVFTPRPVLDEVYEYAGALAAEKGLPKTPSLPRTVAERRDYAAQRAEAARRIEKRDPDDVDLLALALHLKIPVWSNDNDFEVPRSRYTTAELMKTLGTTR